MIVLPSRCFSDNDQSSTIFFRGSVNYFSNTVKTLYLIPPHKLDNELDCWRTFDTTGLDSDQKTARFVILLHVSSFGVD